MRSGVTPVLIACLAPTAVAAQTASERATTADKVFRDVKSRDVTVRDAAEATIRKWGREYTPVLRRELRKAEIGPFRLTMTEALRTLHAKRWEDNVRRAEAWSERGGLDFHTEMLSTAVGIDRTEGLRILVKAREGLSRNFLDLRAKVDEPGPLPRHTSLEVPVNLLTLAKTNVIDKPVATLSDPRGGQLISGVVFCEYCTNKCIERNNCFLAVRSRLTDLVADAQVSEWVNSMLMLNAGFAARELSECLVICDGDFQLNGTIHKIYGSLVICNGDFIADEAVSPHRVANSVVYATGDIKFPAKNKKPSNSLFFAGGKVHDAKAVADAKHIHEGVTEPPFNVRFLDPREFGLTLEVAKGGLAVAKLDEKSPFAVQGLKAGDLITHADDDPMPTVAAFRRELRRGVIDGGLLVRVERDKKVIPMLFEIPDVPKPVKK